MDVIVILLVTTILFFIAYEDLHRLALANPILVLLFWILSALYGLHAHPPLWVGAVFLITAWPFLPGSWWGFLFGLYPPLIPLVLTSAAVRQGRLGAIDLWVFSSLHFVLPWWGPWMVVLGWHLYLVWQARKGFSLIPSLPGLALGWMLAIMGWLVFRFP